MLLAALLPPGLRLACARDSFSCLEKLSRAAPTAARRRCGDRYRRLTRLKSAIVWRQPVEQVEQAF